jgi:predicted alpha/beta superfamily hydrolase
MMKHNLKVTFFLIIFCCFSSFVLARPYSLPNTEVRHLKSNINGIGYILYISLPRKYHQESIKYPVIYTLDADYSFAIAHNIVEHFTDRNDIPNLIVVSIAYEGASQDLQLYRKNRIRDYTPIHTSDQLFGKYRKVEKYSGGGQKFQLFIKAELIPFIESKYRINEKDRTIVGHSMGGLFGAYTLFTMPDLFQKYILVSSSLWYANKLVFDVEKKFSESHSSLDAQVYFCIGAWENYKKTPMVDHQKQFVKQIKSRSYKGLTISSHVFHGETHNSVFPAALSRGLRVTNGKIEF